MPFILNVIIVVYNITKSKDAMKFMEEIQCFSSTPANISKAYVKGRCLVLLKLYIILGNLGTEENHP